MAELLPTVNYAGHYKGNADNPPKLSWHAHKCPELVWVESGLNRTMFPQGVAFDCSAGSLIVTPANLMHRQIDMDCSELYYVGFEPDSPEFDTSLRQLWINDDPHLQHWMKEIRTLFCNEGALEEANGLLRLLLLRLSRRELDHNTNHQKHPALGRAVRFLNERLTGATDLSEIAQAAGISPSHLNALFRQNFGISVMQMLLKKRMDRARMLLADPMKTVADVSYSVGYADPNYFIRVFHRVHGCTPLQFRRKLPQSLSNYTRNGK